MHKLKNLLSLLLLTLLFAAPIQGQGANKPPDQVEKVHSRLPHTGGAVGEIPERLSKTTGDVHVRCVLGVTQKVAVIPPPSPVDELGMLAAESDLVVLGKTGTGTAHMTAEKDFLYTDWNFIVEEVLKSNANSPVYPGATILVTRPGGKLQVNGRTVYATCGDFLDFATGQEYLLYLRFVPETGAYAIGGGWGSFAVSPTTKRLDPFNYPDWKTTDKDTLLKTARDGVVKSGQFPRRAGGSQ
jgi:hypothetical protein